VEAGGVEPPSERAPDEKPTYLVGSKQLHNRRHRARQEPAAASPMDLAPPSRTEREEPARRSGAVFQPTGELETTSLAS
jgi:hypothetical protein